MVLTGRPRGTNDILPAEAAAWCLVEDAFRRHCRLYGFGEIRTPVFEHTELFRRGVGEGTDIVEKEMYSFIDLGGRSVTLRPEGTAAVVRAYLENSLYAGPQPVKLFYVASPMFRYDRPEAGRYRQFHQSGVEVFGAGEPVADAEVIEMVHSFMASLGLKDLGVLVNSIGCRVCRERYREALREYYRPMVDRLCADCRRRFELNPLRLLDCKADHEAAEGAPEITSYLCEGCGQHFSGVRGYLDALGVPYRLSPRIVRGLDYYNRTVFEIIHEGLGAQTSICGGGRYDGLVEVLGGPPTPAVGFAFGMERLLMTLHGQGLIGKDRAGAALQVFVATASGSAPAPSPAEASSAPRGGAAPGAAPATVAGPESPSLALRLAAVRLVRSLRQAGVSADMDMQGRSLKAQMKHAARLGVRAVVIIGEGELERGVVTLRDMASGEQREVEAGRAADQVGVLLRMEGSA